MADLVITLGSSFRTQLYQDGAPVNPPTGGGDTGGGDTGGGDTTYTYSDETQSVIDTITYNPDTNINTFWSNNLTSNLYNNMLMNIYPTMGDTTFTVVTDLNTISTMDQVLSAIETNNTSTFTTSNSAITQSNNDSTTVIVPKAVVEQYSNWSASHLGAMNNTSSIISPVVLIDDDTYLGVVGIAESSFDMNSNSYGYMFSYPAGPVPNGYSFVQLQDGFQDSEIYNYSANDPIFPSDVADGHLCMLYGVASNGSFYSQGYKYSATETASVDNNIITNYHVVVFDYVTMTGEGGWTSGSNPADFGHAEGDYIFYIDSGYLMGLYIVQAGTYVYYNYMQASYSAAGWNINYDYYINNYQGPQNIGSGYIDMSRGTATAFHMSSTGSAYIYMAPSKTLADNIKQLTDAFQNISTQSIVIFKAS